MSLKIGLIGAGGMGSFHARTLAAMGEVEMVAIADPFGDAAARLAAEVGGVASLDWRDVIAAGLDGLVIASPAQAHEEQALAALAAGIPTLCEKPLAVTADECRRVVDAEVALGHRLIQLGLMRVYDPAHVQVAQAVWISQERDTRRNGFAHVRWWGLNWTSGAWTAAWIAAGCRSSSGLTNRKRNSTPTSAPT